MLENNEEKKNINDTKETIILLYFSWTLLSQILRCGNLHGIFIIFLKKEQYCA